MYDTLLVIFLNEAAFIQDLIGFVTAYLTTVFLRCALISVLVTGIVTLLRGTVLRRTVFLKGAIWSLFILVPFFGRLRIYFEGMKQSWKICLPFFMCQELSITLPLIRAIYFAGILFFLLRRMIIQFKMRGLLRETKEAIVCGEKVYVTEMPVSPHAAGLIRPRIMIPRTMTERLSEIQLGTVILHEKTHIRLGHLWIFFAWGIFSSFLWINPLLMLMERKLRADMEQICDSVTIQKSGEEPEEYGKLILRSTIWFRSDHPEYSAMLSGDGVQRDMKERFEMISDHTPYDGRRIAAQAVLTAAVLCVFLIFIRYESHAKYEILPDVVVGDGYGVTYADYDEVERSGAFIRTDDGMMVDAKKLREILPSDFPRNKCVYFYYDVMMKIPGIGGGGECAWLEDLPESGIYPLTVGERDLKNRFALWVMKVL